MISFEFVTIFTLLFICFIILVKNYIITINLYKTHNITSLKRIGYNSLILVSMNREFYFGTYPAKKIIFGKRYKVIYLESTASFSSTSNEVLFLKKFYRKSNEIVRVCEAPPPRPKLIHGHPIIDT